MAKGFLTGVICGGVVSAVGLAFVSPMLPPIQTAPAPVAQAEAPTPVGAPVVAEPPAEVAVPEAESVPVVEVAEETATPTEPADEPMEAPEVMTEEVVEEDTPVADNTVETEAPVIAPEEEVAPEIEAQPQPAAPEAGTSDSAIEEPEIAAPEIAEVVVPAPQKQEVTTDGRSGLGTSVARLEDQAPGVTTNRLPSIGSADATQDAPAIDLAQPLETALFDLSTSPLAIERNAVPALDIGGRPLMAVVLKDMGPERTKLEGLDNLPFPVSVILDVTAPDLNDAIAFYRAAGAEIVMQADLPPEATPTDAEVNLQVQQPKLNMGVAVYMAPDSGFQTNAPLSRQVSEILVASGHGLITQPEGLNTGHKNALKTGVPAGLVFRDLDGNGQDNKVIRRFLDNAAFKADQEEGVILMGRAVPQTLAALVEWSVGNRASSVSMVPVSTVLLGGT
ncbi:polysaccharide deacteylase family 2 protein [uncultured Aliiroseovarius sp.]|uniref:divergent polysaccharide deacetylase family protein n=1 Tax=uncultured Aliiroseovarius sp. TaxID=1658783 RepID=UPI00260FD816|nr:polysaccharide deacteylase family 2 protein [uncultured Aliiroseovarius sp.]